MVTQSVASEGSILFLFVEPGAANAVTERHTNEAGVSFPRTQMACDKRFRLLRVAPNGSRSTIELPELDTTFPFVDVFPDGKVLLASGRCAWHGPEDYDLNGVVVDPDTGKFSRILLGDGINHIQIDTRGRIWVGYFDEGVFGNFGWANPGPAPVGSAGLVCFSCAGEKIWELPYDERHGMADCYALNVFGARAAFYCYTEFPICRIAEDFSQTFWRTSLRGCSVLALTDTKALLGAQYDEPLDTAHVGTTRDGAFCDVEKVRLLLPNGEPIKEGRLIGRGADLYFFDARTVFRATLS